MTRTPISRLAETVAIAEELEKAVAKHETVLDELVNRVAALEARLNKAGETPAG